MAVDLTPVACALRPKAVAPYSPEAVAPAPNAVASQPVACALRPKAVAPKLEAFVPEPNATA